MKGWGIDAETELEWSNKEVIVLYLTCEDYGKKGHYIVEDKGQGVVKGKE